MAAKRQISPGEAAIELKKSVQERGSAVNAAALGLSH
jgi:hypothetical protein